MYTKDDKHYIGDKEVIVDEDDFIIEGKKYSGTDGLWELIRSKDPKDYTDSDLKGYGKILMQTNAIWRDNDPSTRKPKSSRSDKYRKIIKPFYNKMIAAKGSGTIFLPEDANALVKRLELAMASRLAGNTGVVNEIVSILDELHRKKHITDEQYKRVVSGIK